VVSTWFLWVVCRNGIVLLYSVAYHITATDSDENTSIMVLLGKDYSAAQRAIIGRVLQIKEVVKN